MNKIDLSFANTSLDRFFGSNKVVNPVRDWKIVLVFLFVFVTSSLVFDFILYRKIASGEMYVTVHREDLMLESLKKDDLKRTVDNFESRKLKMINLKIEPLIDPSL